MKYEGTTRAGPTATATLAVQPPGNQKPASVEPGVCPRAVLTFANFCLDLQNQELWQEDRAIRLAPRTFEVLRCLVERSQRLVTKRELLDVVWAGVVVSEGVIKTHIREVRRSLGDTADPPRFVETLHRRGYRFLCSVERRDRARPTDRKTNVSGTELARRALVVGRGAEIGELSAWLEEARLGRTRVVFVTGEAGIGKTTLINAFLAEHRSSGELWVASGQCIEQYGSGSAYLPILEALGQLSAGPNASIVLEAFRRHAPDWLAQMPEGFGAAAGGVLEGNCIPSSPERLMRQMAAAVDALTAVRPLVLAIEDLQWVDPSSLNLLSYLAQRSSGGRLLVVGTYRSGDVRLTEHPLWAFHQLLNSRGLCQELALSKLTPRDVQGYLAQHFSRHLFPAEFGEQVFRITSGNPLFMVRVMDGLIRRGLLYEQDGCWTLAGDVDGIHVTMPDSVLSMITWELDRVAESEREVLDAAAVTGLEFTAPEVAHALARDATGVEALCRRWIRQGRFLEQVFGRNEERSVALRCRFSHALYQQVLYEQLGPSRRAQLHGLLAKGLEARHLSLPQPIAASLALHFSRAGHWDRAIRYGCLAGEYALGRSAYAEAIYHLRAALALLEQMSESDEQGRQELTILLALRVPLVATLGYGASEVELLYTRATEKSLQFGHTESAFAVQAGVSLFQLVRGRIQDSLAAARQCLLLAAGNGDLLPDAELAAGVACFYAGEFAAATTHLQATLTSGNGPRPYRKSMYHHDAELLAPIYSSYLFWYAGHPARAKQQAHEILRLARVTQSPFTLAAALHGLASLLCYDGDGEELARTADELRNLCSDRGFAFYAGVAVALRAVATLYLGDLEAGIRELRNARNVLLASGSVIGDSLWCAELACAYAMTGELESGFLILREGLEGVRLRGERYWEPELYRAHGELCVRALGGSSYAGLPGAQRSCCGFSLDPEVSFQRALTSARDLHARPLELRAIASLTRFHSAMPHSRRQIPSS